MNAPVRMDDSLQAGLGFLERQTSHIESQVWEVQYPDIIYPTLVPIDTSAHEWARSITYYSMDKTGAARWHNAGARDVPRADVAREQHETAVHMAAIGYVYNLEEINQARMLGLNLDASKAMAARRAYEELCEVVAISGDTGKGFEGLINNSNVSDASVPNGASTSPEWSTKTADEILADVNAAITGVWSGSLTVELADTILLPLAQYALLFTKRLGDTTMNVHEYIVRNNIYTAQTGKPLTIRALRQLAGAGTGASDRMVAYRKSPEVLKMHIPMPLKFLAPQQVVFEFLVPGMFRLGGVDVRRPGAMRYYDDI